MERALRNEFSNPVEFVHINAPHVELSSANIFCQQYAWWLNTKDFPYVDFKVCLGKTLDIIL